MRDGLEHGEPHGDASPLSVLSYPLLPADPTRVRQIVEAPPDWRFDPAAFDPEAVAVMWGRTSDRSSPLRMAVRAAAAREVALRTFRRRIPPHLHLNAVHRLPPRQLEPRRPRGAIIAAIRSGALIELGSLPGGARVLDKVLEEADIRRRQTGFHSGAGGAMVIHVVQGDGSPALLRVSRAGAPGDPALTAETLERLARARIPLTPRVTARGHTAGASWVVERSLPGRPPARMTVELTQQIANVLAAFPMGDGPPSATPADLAAIAARLPDLAGAVDRLRAEFADQVRGLPSVLRHGDLWSGNVLVERGRLSGLVDWDAAHPAALPGTDLLQLIATELRKRNRRELGPAFLSRPWRLPIFLEATRDYWQAFHIQPVDTVLSAVGIAWWATEVHGTLVRLPHRATDRRWVATNVEPVLNALGY